jgi:hypothetical protein
MKENRGTTMIDGAILMVYFDAITDALRLRELQASL